jgi:hypothetical protein
VRCWLIGETRNNRLLRTTDVARTRKARLANSILQGVRGNLADDEALEFPPHGFQIFHFAETPLASREMQLASQRIRRAQFSIEKSVQDEFPIRTGAGRSHAGFGRWRREHGNAHHYRGH